MNNFNFNNFIKYIILFIVVTFSTFFIPSCNMISRHVFIFIISINNICSFRQILSNNSYK